jgi:hypothetical protein
MIPQHPTIPDRLDLLERLQEQQSAINDITRQALVTLNETLRTQQRTMERDGHLLTLLLQRITQHDDVLARQESMFERLDATMQAITDLLNRPPNGH